MATIDFKTGATKRDNLPNEDEIIEDFGDLIRRRETAETNQNLYSIISKLETDMKKNSRYILKMFLVDMDTGSMMNSDISPNISFRVDTINLIFDSIYQSIRALGIDAERAGAIFYDAGKTCGSAFGKTFNNYIKKFKNGGGLSLNEKISEWCKFDSSVGWGKLAYDEKEGTVLIHNNFQAKANEDTDDFPIDCNFFRGYVAGVLGRLLRKDLEVQCAALDKGLCPKTTTEHTCVLKFK